MSATTTPLKKDITVMGLVGSAHAASHFFHLILPPLFPILKNDFEVSYAALGLLTTLFYGASGTAQTIAGFLVDRFGARKVLLSGLSLLSISVIGYGFADSFWVLVLLSIAAGLGNSVFHPADLSILTVKISPNRLGKAYAVHALSGNLGWAVAPIFVVTLAHLWDWRTATFFAGLVGLIFVFIFIIWGKPLADRRIKKPHHPFIKQGGYLLAKDIKLLFSPPILSCFFFFAFLAASLVGIQTFGVAAVQNLYSIDLAGATVALTAFLLGSAGGILIGGILADKTNRHDIIAMIGVALAGIVLILIGAQMITSHIVILILALAGLFSGTTAPSRDMLVRKATPTGATGRIFGFVYSGLDLGSSLMPILLGLLMDRGKADQVFYACAIALLITITTVMKVRQKSPPAKR